MSKETSGDTIIPVKHRRFKEYKAIKRSGIAAKANLALGVSCGLISGLSIGQWIVNGEFGSIESSSKRSLILSESSNIIDNATVLLTQPGALEKPIQVQVGENKILFEYVDDSKAEENAVEYLDTALNNLSYSDEVENEIVANLAGTRAILGSELDQKNKAARLKIIEEKFLTAAEEEAAEQDDITWDEMIREPTFLALVCGISTIAAVATLRIGVKRFKIYRERLKNYKSRAMVSRGLVQYSLGEIEDFVNDPKNGSGL